MANETHETGQGRQRKTPLTNPVALWDLLVRTSTKWSQDPVMRFGAALAYYSTFAILPLLIFIIMLIGSLVGVEKAESFVVDHLEGFMGKQSAEAITYILEHWQEAGATWLGIGTAFGALFFAATGAFNQLQDALNTIWGVEPTTERGLLGRLRKRFLSLLGLFGTAFLLLMLLTLSAGVTTVGHDLITILPGPERVLNVTRAVLTFGLITVLFAMIYKFLPRADIAWGDVWIGAVVTALLFSAGRLFIVLYLGRSLLISLYGSAGALVILLLWVYFSAQILLFGAEFTAVYASQYGSRVIPKDDAVASGEPAKTDQELRQSQQRPA